MPLGGGAAVFEHLVAEWSRTRPFELKAITPAILGTSAPSGGELVKFGERAYARFCREFERASTAEILRHDRRSWWFWRTTFPKAPISRSSARAVIAFHHLSRGCGGVRRGNLRQRRDSAGNYRSLVSTVARCLPEIAGLIWEKQASSVRHSRGLIVPSEGMRDVLLRCYPDCGREKIQVLPWGNWNADDTVDPEPLRREFGVPEDARVLLTLSRISPEKGQDLLLNALLDRERRADFPAYPLWLFVCGDAAFMQGQRFLDKLRQLAGLLKRTRVVFPGYVTGDRKRAFLALADLYVFPSRRESYGLTLMEALAAGLPAVCLDTIGAREVMREEFGALVPASGLRTAISRLLADDGRRKQMSSAARQFARHQRFSDRAAELANVLSRF